MQPLNLPRRNSLNLGIAIAAVVLLVIALIYAGVERRKRANFQQTMQELATQVREAENREQAAKAEAKLLAQQLIVKQALYAEMAKRAEASERTLLAIQDKVVPRKKAYEEARDRTVPLPVDLSNCDACVELAGAGHPCVAK